MEEKRKSRGAGSSGEFSEGMRGSQIGGKKERETNYKRMYGRSNEEIRKGSRTVDRYLSLNITWEVKTTSSSQGKEQQGGDVNSHTRSGV